MNSLYLGLKIKRSKKYEKKVHFQRLIIRWPRLPYKENDMPRNYNSYYLYLFCKFLNNFCEKLILWLNKIYFSFFLICALRFSQTTSLISGLLWIILSEEEVLIWLKILTAGTLYSRSVYLYHLSTCCYVLFGALLRGKRLSCDPCFAKSRQEKLTMPQIKHCFDALYSFSSIRYYS